MDDIDFQELWNQYVEEIRSQGGLTQRTQDKFWNSVYPDILDRAKKISSKKKLKNSDFENDPIDLVHDVFLRLSNTIRRNPPSFKSRDKFIGYIYKAIDNLRNSQLKKEGRNLIGISEPLPEEDNLSLLDSQNNIEVYALDKILKNHKDCLELFKAKFVDKLKYNEIINQIAQFRDKTEEALRTMKKRCKPKLKAIINNYYLNFES